MTPLAAQSAAGHPAKRLGLQRGRRRIAAQATSARMLAILMGLGLLSTGGIEPAAGRSQSQTPDPDASSQSIPVRCRVADGPWRPCVLHVERIGEHWWIDIGQQRLDFRHDGQGTILLTQSGAPPRLVQGHWQQSPQALCWDGICALGPLPLD